MMDLIQQLVQLLSQAGLTLDDVIAKVGPVINDPGGLMPVELAPILPGIKTANIARDPDSGEPYTLTIEPDTHLSPAMLQATFGDYRRVRTHRGQPPEIIFYPPPGDSGYKVAVLATLQSASEPFDDQQISRLSLRRDRVS